ncbi:hypothetical protein K0M31_012213 [Melipona bicolor]|uniref:Uncharacterized protein n=1 Tax=Melipona bicolor TaxID=60889 RepID=A0AA40KHJ8_9HYME|nr:hypothetical protein K0M31_012213 [Melipona bicolor]
MKRPFTLERNGPGDLDHLDFAFQLSMGIRSTLTSSLAHPMKLEERMGKTERPKRAEGWKKIVLRDIKFPERTDKWTALRFF